MGVSAAEVLARPARAAHGAYGIQGRVDEPVARGPGRRGVRICAGAGRGTQPLEHSRRARAALFDRRYPRCAAPAAKPWRARIRRSSFTWRRRRWSESPTAIRSAPTRPMSWAPRSCLQACRALRASRVRGRRHQRQGVRERGRGPPLRGRRPAGRPRSVQQQQGLCRIGDCRVFATASLPMDRRSQPRARAMSSAAATGRRIGSFPTASGRSSRGKP